MLGLQKVWYESLISAQMIPSPHVTSHESVTYYSQPCQEIRRPRTTHPHWEHRNPPPPGTRSITQG